MNIEADILCLESQEMRAQRLYSEAELLVTRLNRLIYVNASSCRPRFDKIFKVTTRALYRLRRRHEAYIQIKVALNTYFL